MDAILKNYHLIILCFAVSFLIGCKETGKEETNIDEKSKTEKEHIHKVTITQSESKSSQSLSELAKKNSVSKVVCEKQFLNENGVCEIPNHPHPQKDDNN